MNNCNDIKNNILWSIEFWQLCDLHEFNIENENDNLENELNDIFTANENKNEVDWFGTKYYYTFIKDNINNSNEINENDSKTLNY